MNFGTIIVVEHHPITPVRAYGQATGLIPKEMAALAEISEADLWLAWKGEPCGREVARAIEVAFGLPRDAVQYVKKRCQWTLHVGCDGRAMILESGDTQYFARVGRAA